MGLLHALGSRRSFERLTVEVGGQAYRLPLEALTAEAHRRPALVRCIVYYAQAAMLQATQSTACNALHVAEQRFCRWLLLTQDRLGGSDLIPLTQEHPGIMLGVRRTTVTAIASDVQANGHISYARGMIRILDREALQRCACECYVTAEEAAAQMRPEASP